jgi:ATP adenylyltransferase
MKELGGNPPAGEALFRAQIRVASERALDSGALAPIRTKSEQVDDRGVRFLIRIVDGASKKPKRSSENDRNPFLTPERDLIVAEYSTTHLCLLNKYPVVDDHLLIVTRQYEPQHAPLTGSDFTALAHCLAQYDALGFYNCGKVAGSSQTHKHLQVIPLPLEADLRQLPIAPLLPTKPKVDMATRVRALPFEHALIGLPDGSDGHRWADQLDSNYRLLRAELKLTAAANGRMPPYNLLVTANWMMMIPRRREHFHSISLNAMAFAGALLVKNERQFKLLVQKGPTSALEHVAGY